MDAITHADTAEDFQREVVDADRPVLVDFWAAWCGPCRMVAPEVEALAERYGERLKVVKTDVDAAPEVAGRYGVRGIPALALFSGGRVVAEAVGAMPRDAIAARLELDRWTAEPAAAAGAPASGERRGVVEERAAAAPRRPDGAY